MISGDGIVFQNECAVVVDKPAGWLSIPGRDPKDSRPVLGRELETFLKTKIFPVHRLDAEVSGLIVYAKTAEFHREANQLFENKQISKTYQAFTPLSSTPPFENLMWTCRLLRGKKRAYESPHGKPAITEARVIRHLKTVSEWHLRPITGRAHQLRFEMARHGVPILGDVLYGSQVPWPTPGIALRAIHLEWPADFASRWSLPAHIETLRPLQMAFSERN